MLRRPALRLVIAFLFTLAGCVPKTEAQTQAVPADTVITLERTACFGTCPVYSVSIDSAGNVTYDGSGHVRVTGRQQSRIPAARVAALLDSAERIEFFTLRDHYRTIRNADGTESTVSDRPTAFVTITTGGRTKRIEDYIGAPVTLREYEQQIDEAARTIRWVRIDEETLEQLAREGWSPTQEEQFQLLLNALLHDHVGVVKGLIALGVDPSATFRSSPLLLVRSAAAARVLLAAGADPHERGSFGATPLDTAAYLAPEVTQALLEAGARADEPSDDGRRPLFSAACSGNIGVVQLLLNAGALPAHRTLSGESALECARIGKKKSMPPSVIERKPPFVVDFNGVIALLERALATRKQ